MKSNKTCELPREDDASSDESSPSGSDDSFDWKMYRKTSRIIESLKKRIGKGERKEEKYSPSKSPQYGSHSLDRMLEELVPQKKALSPEAQKCLSLERNRNIFKVPPTHLSLACMFDSIASSSGCSPVSEPVFTDRSPTSDTQSTRKAASLPLPPKALSDSVAYECSTSKKSDMNGNNMNIAKYRKAVKKPPFHSSMSSPSGFGNRLVLQNNPELTPSQSFDPRQKTKEVMTIFDRYYGKEDEDIEGPLLSPSFAQPFRPRAMAIRLKDSERPRSVSAPASPDVEMSSRKSLGSDTDR